MKVERKTNGNWSEKESGDTVECEDRKGKLHHRNDLHKREGTKGSLEEISWSWKEGTKNGTQQLVLQFIKIFCSR